MEYSDLCSEILKIDRKIRFVGIYDEGILCSKIREGITPHLNKDETEISLSQSVYQWANRKKLASKIGNPLFSMTQYEKINRITIPIRRAGLILVSTEVDSNPKEVAQKIIQLREKFESQSLVEVKHS